MKKVFVLILSLCLVITVLSAYASSAPKEPEYAEGLPWKVEKLPERVKLNVGHLVAGPHALPTYVAEKKGWLDAVGIELEWHMFPNGPAMAEAMAADAWDCGATGIGGVLSGVIGYDSVVLGVSTEDSGTHRSFARPGSKIVGAGKGHLPNFPDVYGTAEAWKGAEVMLPRGTTAHYVLAKTLEQFGLTVDDIKFVAMDVTSANTAFKAGQGDVASVWGNLIFTEDKKDFVVVTGGLEIEIGSVSNIVANPRSLAGPKKEAIIKWLELYQMATQWIIDNLEEGTQMFVEHSEYEGIISNYDETLTLMRYNKFFTLEDNYNFFNQRVRDGKMSKQEEFIYNPLSFFVDQGAYQPEALDKLISGYFKGEYIKQVYERHK